MENEYPVHHTKNVWETRSSRIVIPSEAEGSFSLAVRGRVFGSEKRETPYRGKAVAVLPIKGLAKGEGKRALFLLEMRGISQKKVLTYETANHSYLHAL